MKLRLTLAVGCLFFLAACSSTDSAQSKGSFPEKRPADFEVFLEEFDGPEGPKVQYVIGPELAKQTLFRESGETKWEFKPGAKELDELYHQLHTYKVTSLKSKQDPGNVKKAYGNFLQLKWEGKTFTLEDRGDFYLQSDEDSENFMFIRNNIRTFLRMGLMPQVVRAEVEVILDAVPDSLKVDLEQDNLIDWASWWKVGDTVRGSYSPLKGKYGLMAKAMLDDSVWTLNKELDLAIVSNGHTRIHFTKEGFKAE
ncbi:MAG: hypothetical protein RLZZ519_181 [Bacteroidota bacterium]|jgi:hypothetical protein